ncbi:MAG TPA: helix-turn-helix transcriptional regulator [Chloroflexota bacterium]|nr:helix-turn-helix transcriptional regulator [Chloroflexota bacterium]
MTDPPRHRIEWRLAVLMAHRRIKTVADLRVRLVHAGVTFSATQLGRIIHDPPRRLNLNLVEGPPAVLDCDISDLLLITISGEPKPAEEPEDTDRDSG